MDELVKELKEIKELLRIIAGNTEQNKTACKEMIKETISEYASSALDDIT